MSDPLVPLSYPAVTPPSVVISKTPCPNCSEEDLCSDCWQIRLAEEKQKQDVDERMRGRSFGTNGASEAASELDERGHNLGKKPGAKKGPTEALPIGFNAVGESELPALMLTPTGLGKLRSKLADIDCGIDAFKKMLNTASGPAERARLEWLLKMAQD